LKRGLYLGTKKETKGRLY